MEMSKLIPMFLLVGLYRTFWCALCPNNSTIMTDDSRFWCVWLADQKLPIESMVKVCASLNGIIFEIPDRQVQTFFDNVLVPVLEESKAKTIWVNYNESEASTLEGESTSYTNWKNNTNREGCVSASVADNYFWDRSPCNNSYHGLCYRELDCHPRGIYALDSDLCFWPTFIQETQADGQIRCESQNSTLAVFPMMYVWDFVVTNPAITYANMMYGHSSGFWLGINDTIKEGVYRQIDGDDVPFLIWTASEPDGYAQIEQDCILLKVVSQAETGDAGMADDDCESTRLSLCMKDQSYVEPSEPSSSLSTTTERNAVGEPSVSKSVFNTTTESNAQCSYLVCTCPPELYNVQFTTDSEAFTQHLEQLKKETVIDAKNTSAYKKSLVCATDDRPSSEAIGLTSAVILMSLFGLIVIADVIAIGKSLVLCMKTMK